MSTRRQEAGRAAEFVYFMGSTAAFQASRFVLNVLAAAALPVAIYGLWGLVIVVLTYTAYANLGLLSGANRQIPILIGESRAYAADRLEAVAAGGTVLAGAAVGTLVLFASLLVGGVWADVAMAVALAVAAQQLYLFYQVSLRARLAFNEASVQQALLAVLLPAIGIPLLVTVGINGLVLSYAAVFLVGSLLVQLWWRRSIRPVVSPAEIVALIRPGLPIMLTGLVFGLLVSTDRWITLVLLGEEVLGHYTLAATVSSSVQLILVVMAQQFYPRLAMDVGRRGVRPDLFRIALRQSWLNVAAVLPIALVLVVLSGPAIGAFLPRYADAVGPLQVLAIGYGVLAFSNGFTNLLVAVGRYWSLLLLHVVALLVAVALTTGAALLGLGTPGIAAGMVVSFALLTASSMVLGWRSVRD